MAMGDVMIFLPTDPQRLPAQTGHVRLEAQHRAVPGVQGGAQRHFGALHGAHKFSVQCLTDP